MLSGIAAANSQGSRRAFWSGFFATMLIASMREVFGFMYGAKLDWTRKVSMELVALWRGTASGYGQQILNVNTTLILLTFLVAATVIGYLSVVVFRRCQESASE